MWVCRGWSVCFRTTFCLSDSLASDMGRIPQWSGECALIHTVPVCVCCVCFACRCSIKGFPWIGDEPPTVMPVGWSPWAPMCHAASWSHRFRHHRNERYGCTSGGSALCRNDCVRSKLGILLPACRLLMPEPLAVAAAHTHTHASGL